MVETRRDAHMEVSGRVESGTETKRRSRDLASGASAP
ncbi:MAG: hypothetical protein ACI9MF_002877, partial [Gammaproteobacteria bacterium]